MRQILWVLCVGVAVAALGCAEAEPDANAGTPNAGGNGANPQSGFGDGGPALPAGRDPQSGSPESPAAADGLDGVPVQAGVAAIDGQNTKLAFVGTKPDGRSHDGGFSEFAGQIQVDEASGQVTAITVDIETPSIWADNSTLTGHLKNADFFNVQAYPTAKFESTSIEGRDGDLTVVGELTMLDNTQEISFPAQARVTDGRLSLDSEFQIDRTQFGMTYGEGMVDKEVTIRVTVGAAPEAAAANP